MLTDGIALASFLVMDDSARDQPDPSTCPKRGGGPHVRAPLDAQCIHCQASLVSRDGKWQSISSRATARPVSTPYFTSSCYACDAPACGVRDRRPEGGMVEAACARHADPTIRAHAACGYCSGRLAARSHDFAHKACLAAEVAS